VGGTGSCSDQEAGSLRTRGTHDAAPVRGEDLEVLWRVTGVNSHSKTEESGVQCLQIMAAAKTNKQAKTTKITHTCLRKVELVHTCKCPFFCFFFQPGSQPIGYCHPHSGLIFPLNLLDHMTIISRNTLRHTQKCALPIFQASVNPIKLITHINHHKELLFFEIFAY
jgi:hypothetical protein